MNVRYVFAIAAGVVVLAIGGVASAQMAGNAGTSVAAQSMPQNFARMQQMMAQAHAARTWNERMRLMQSHMQLMQQQMGSMMGAMGLSMQSGQGMGKGMMHGGGQSMGRGMTNGNAGDLQAQVTAMQARMHEMAQMMQQMLEQQQLMLQKAAAGRKGGG